MTRRLYLLHLTSLTGAETIADAARLASLQVADGMVLADIQSSPLDADNQPTGPWTDEGAGCCAI